MKPDKTLKLKARWEMDTFPAGDKAQRGLLIEITGKELPQKASTKRPPLNLALVIDRSGSMANGRLAAARKAAIGISRSLRKTDHLSIVAFDDRITVLLDGVKQDKAGRKAAKAAIGELQPGGCTDLCAGWLQGAKCVARLMETHDITNGHVLLLSDGHANRGTTSPAELSQHASELAARGVTSSCVGIGSGYSPLQLDAIAEAGNGNLHHSNDPDEIIATVMGEIGDITHLAARNAELVISFPRGIKAKQLTNFGEQAKRSNITLRTGDIVSGRTRRVAFMVDVGKNIKAGKALPFTASLSWQQGEASTTQTRSKDFDLRAVDPAEFDPLSKRKNVAKIIAELWLARMGYEAMRLNEQGEYDKAVDAFASNDASLDELLKDLKQKERDMLMERSQRTRAAVADEWTGTSKRVAYSLSRKFARGESEQTDRSSKDWSDSVPD
jgi:Ca-activated chloride channel family protein